MKKGCLIVVVSFVLTIALIIAFTASKSGTEGNSNISFEKVEDGKQRISIDLGDIEDDKEVTFVFNINEQEQTYTQLVKENQVKCEFMIDDNYIGYFDCKANVGEKVILDDEYYCNDYYGIQSKQPKYEVLEVDSKSDSIYSYAIGKIRNNSDKDLSYAQVEINLYDASGNQIGSTLDNVNNLEAGGVWSFKAPILESRCVNFRVEDITGF